MESSTESVPPASARNYAKMCDARDNQHRRRNSWLRDAYLCFSTSCQVMAVPHGCLEDDQILIRQTITVYYSFCLPSLLSPSAGRLATISRLKGKWDILCEQISCRMVDVIVGEAGHGKVTVVVVRLFPDIDAFLLAD